MRHAHVSVREVARCLAFWMASSASNALAGQHGVFILASHEHGLALQMSIHTHVYAHGETHVYRHVC